MAREELRAASEELREASDLAEGEAAERLATQADQVGELATREADPDHGRLDRHRHALEELVNDVGDRAAERVEAARERIREYRKGVEGV